MTSKGNLVNGKHTEKMDSPKPCKVAKLEPKEPQLNPDISEPDFKRKFKDAFSNKTHKLDDNGVTVYDKPFTCCHFKNFISNQSYLQNLKEELMNLEFFQKNNDLYKFKQSDDLKTVSSPHIKTLRHLLYDQFLSWLKETTNITLTDQVDMSCSLYNDTDILLCHDDELEDRRIAFILYLVPESWSTQDGGILDLFSMDEHGQPDKIIESIVPSWNSLVIFEVTEASFHQVSEVLSDKTRVSVGGWFHGPPVERPQRYIEPSPSVTRPLSVEDDVLLEWVNPLYLNTEIVSDIRTRFEDESEIELIDFLLEDKFKQVLEELSGENVTWETKGPYNKRFTKKALVPSLPPTVKKCFEFLHSKPLFKLLKTLTGINLADIQLESAEDTGDEDNEEENETDPRCYGEVRHWTHGCYTLVHDTDPGGAEFALDAMLFLGCKDWDSAHGGFTSYLAREEDEELLTVVPSDNSLALVYRDKDTLRFVKHINHQSLQTDDKSSSSTGGTREGFYDFSFVYFE